MEGKYKGFTIDSAVVSLVVGVHLYVITCPTTSLFRLASDGRPYPGVYWDLRRRSKPAGTHRQSRKPAVADCDMMGTSLRLAPIYSLSDELLVNHYLIIMSGWDFVF